MPGEPSDRSLGMRVEAIRDFLNEFSCRLADVDAIEETIRGIAQDRGEDWPWITRWVGAEGPRWTNDMETLVFETAVETLSGTWCLHFTQQVWMLQPSLFEYQVWAKRAFVRMWWDPSRSAFPGQAPS